MRHHNTHDAYLITLSNVWNRYEHRSSPRGLPIREIANYYFEVINPTAEPIQTMSDSRNEVIASYTKKELDLYRSCSNRVEDFAQASKFWEKIANPDGTINSAYGYLIWENESMGSDKFSQKAHWSDRLLGSKVEKLTPWEWCVRSLKDDKDSRQAIMKFLLPEHLYLGNKDVTCTTHGVWSIRDDKLNLSIVMRSNDVVKGLAFDLPFFCSLMDTMLHQLSFTYPNLQKGRYSHFVHSMHAYEKDEKVILEMLGKA